MEALSTPIWVFIFSFSTSLLFIWLGRRREERIMREMRELEKKNRRLEWLSIWAVHKIRDKNRDLRCEREYFDRFSAENEKYIFLGRFLFLAREKLLTQKRIAVALGCSEARIHQLCSRYGIQTVGVINRDWARTKRLLKELKSDKENQGKMTNEHE